MILKLREVGGPLSKAGFVAGSLSALWTFPCILFSSFLIAWGAEAAQFLMSQGLALAILAWLQTLPEFAVEAVIAWEAGTDPAKTHLAIANFTGSLRLLVGVGWPLIYFVAAAFAHKHKKRRAFADVELEEEHSVEVFGLILPILYFFVIWWKASLTIWDAIPLTLCYAVYLFVLWRLPAHKEEGEALEDLGVVPRRILRLSPFSRAVAITLVFLAGGALLYFSAHPFLESMLALAASFGVSRFVFVQWVAPFLSEFPEKVSAFYWARKVTTANVALMNMVSSNINQWSILPAMVPIIFVISAGRIQPLQLDAVQQREILLTILQSLAGFTLLCNMKLSAHEAFLLLVFWMAQFAMPEWRDAMIYVYLGWCSFEVLRWVARGRMPAAFRAFRNTMRRRFAAETLSS